MRIDKDIKPNLLETLAKSLQVKPQKEAVAGTNQSTDMSDKVEISARNKEIGKIASKVNDVPAIKQDRVDNIREAIKNGTYNVQGELVARGIMKSNILDEVL